MPCNGSLTCPSLWMMPLQFDLICLIISFCQYETHMLILYRFLSMYSHVMNLPTGFKFLPTLSISLSLSLSLSHSLSLSPQKEMTSAT